MQALIESPSEYSFRFSLNTTGIGRSTKELNVTCQAALSP